MIELKNELTSIEGTSRVRASWLLERLDKIDRLLDQGIPVEHRPKIAKHIAGVQAARVYHLKRNHWGRVAASAVAGLFGASFLFALYRASQTEQKEAPWISPLLYIGLFALPIALGFQASIAIWDSTLARLDSTIKQLRDACRNATG